MKITQSELQSSLAEGLARHHVPGASIAVLNKGELITATAGVTNVSTGVSVTPETVMHIGSITKIFNATVVMQLVDEGKIDLDERVLRYVPELRLADVQALQHITVRMLLNHTSGIDGEGLPDCGHDDETIEKGILRFRDLGQLFEPGTDYSYSNAATVIAGYLAQRVAGTSWYTLVKERIFRPLGMEHAAVLPEDAILHRASVGHYWSPESGKLVRTPFAFLPMSWAPCGTTLMMSAADLITFARAHMALGLGTSGTRILSAVSAKLMQKIAIDNTNKSYNFGRSMGIAWMIAGRGLLLHAGTGPGVAAALYVHPDSDFAVAVLTNGDRGFFLANDVARGWLHEVAGVDLLGEEVHLPSCPLKVGSAGYVGSYETGMLSFIISESEEGLVLSRQARFVRNSPQASMKATPPAALVPLGENRFLLERFFVGPEHREEILPGAFRVFEFRNPDSQGRMQHLGWCGRLFRRARGQ